MKRLLEIFCVTLISYFLPSCVLAVDPLQVSGNTIINPEGTRFIIKGVNVEAFRDYVRGCGYVTDNLFVNSNLSRMVQAMKNVDANGGINAVRLNYDYRYINQGSYQNLSKYLDIAQAFANAGIYVMPSDHSQDGTPLTNMDQALPTMKAIIDGFRSRGIEQYLILNPFNEPDKFSSKTDLITAHQQLLFYLRQIANYKGIVVLLVFYGNSQTDTSLFQSILSYDAGLLGGKPNVVFSNHWYANWPINTYVNGSFQIAKDYPLIIDEVGQQIIGSTALDPQYVTDLLNLELTTGIPNGHNGVFAWIWHWCDMNGMTDPRDGYETLNTYGNLYKPYWSQVPVDPTPLPTATPTETSPTTPTQKPGDANRDG